MIQTNCLDLWLREQASRKIITLCKVLDDYLGGGIAMFWLTELCGAPGSGKTQFCLQLCINVQFPRSVGGVGGNAIYVDTKQDFHPERLQELAIHMEHRFAKANISDEHSEKQKSFNASTMLENVSYVYCRNYKTLYATIINFHELIKEKNAIKLIVIDSFSFPLRQIDDVAKRTSMNYELINELRKLALHFEIAIVLTNELTTSRINDNWEVYPALGVTHLHKINQRIILTKAEGSACHQALIDKSVVSPKVIIPFKIMPSGIRGFKS